MFIIRAHTVKSSRRFVASSIHKPRCVVTLMAAREARLSLLLMYWLQASSDSVSTYESSSETAGSAAATAREPRLEPASSCSCSFLSSVDPNPSEWTDSSRCS